MILTHKDILLQLEKIERKLTNHDEDIALIFQYLKQLLNPPQPARRKIGFRKNDDRLIFSLAAHSSELIAFLYFCSMADVHDKETRSYNMSHIRNRNTKPEMPVRKFLHAMVCYCLVERKKVSATFRKVVNPHEVIST